MNIKIEKLSKSFEGKPVISDFSAEIKEGSVTAVMGPSGCGKTTLVRILAGLLPPDSGKVTGLPGKVSCVFQEDRLCEDFSVLSNITLLGVPRNIAEEHLERVGLKNDIGQKAGMLSGGMKRRTAIVRAVLAGRPLIILDEPFKGIDDGTKADVYEYLRKETAGKTVIIVTHDIEDATALGAEILEMKKI